MKAKTTKIKNSFYFEIDKYEDDRGCFQELYNVGRYSKFLEKVKQINKSFSKKDVIRGIHKAPFSKLVSCIKGKIYDVVVDLRKDSLTHKEWHGHWLTPENNGQLLIPANCGHAFFAAEDSIVVYCQDDTYNPNIEISVNWKDPSLGIDWPKPSKNYIVSDKDKEASFYED